MRIGPVPSTAAGGPSGATKLPRVIASRSATVATNAASAMKRANRRIGGPLYGGGDGVWPGKLLGGPFGELDGRPVRGEAGGGELGGTDGVGVGELVIGRTWDWAEGAGGRASSRGR